MFLRKVEICGVNTAKLPLLNNEEMRALFVQAQAGDKPARDQLVQSNLRLVLSIVQRFGNRGENPDDLFQVGCIGLLKAIDNFDLSMNVRFSTYAVPMIIGEIRRYLRDNNAIRVSRSVRDVAYKALSARDELAAQKGVEPKMQEIAERLSLPASQVVFALDAIAEPVSLFEPIFNDGGDPIYVVDQVKDERESEQRWTEELCISNALACLNEREQKIINLRFFVGKTQMEVADEIGISQAQVSRLEKNALLHLRRYV
ncbi:MAG: RNA polymerase sporulation sigma factor SigG [Peptococcaceae bacterium]|nr:RNA polymerase sporulation sigma factor SigG [Peptococcaceae bacterium]